MKKKLTVLLLCTMVAAAGCGSASSGKKTESAAQSTASAAAGEDTAASAAESEEEMSEQINLSSAEDVKAAGLTDSELVEMAYYLEDGEALSDGEYPSDEDFEEDLDFSDQLMVDVTGIPGVEIGSEAVLVGKSGDAYLDPAEIGESCGELEHGIMCGMSVRLPYIYL